MIIGENLLPLGPTYHLVERIRRLWKHQEMDTLVLNQLQTVSLLDSLVKERQIPQLAIVLVCLGSCVTKVPIGIGVRHSSPLFGCLCVGAFIAGLCCSRGRKVSSRSS